MEAESNRIGQQLGARGLRTRTKLLAAAEKLLQSASPMDLNAASIAREAATSAATFYVYFDDVREVLFDLGKAAAPALAELFPSTDSLLDASRLDADIVTFVSAVNAAWDRHAAILLYRNLEADRGDDDFHALRYASARPILARLGQSMRLLGGARSEEAIAAEAVVLLAAVERIAATTHERFAAGPSAASLQAALVRLIGRAIRSD